MYNTYYTYNDPEEATNVFNYLNQNTEFNVVNHNLGLQLPDTFHLTGQAGSTILINVTSPQEKVMIDALIKSLAKKC